MALPKLRKTHYPDLSLQERLKFERIDHIIINEAYIYSMSSIFKFYVYNNFHIALCAAAFTAEYYLRSELTYDRQYLSFVFFSTIFLYGLHRIIGIKKLRTKQLNKRMLLIKSQSKALLYIILISAVVSGILFIQLPLSVILMCVIPVFISLLYALPLFRDSKRLRDFPFLKIFLIAIVWTWICYYIPASFSGNVSYLYLVECICFMLMITLPFDIRDIAVDSISGTKTIPAVLGIKKTKILGSILLLIALTTIYFITAPLTVQLAIVISYLLAWIFLLCSNKNRGDLYYSFFIDGLLILRFLIIYIFIHYLSF